MHLAKIVHRDIRSSNIVYFEDSKRWQLIDYGLSGKVGDDFGIQLASNQYERCGGRIKKICSA